MDIGKCGSCTDSKVFASLCAPVPAGLETTTSIQAGPQRRREFSGQGGKTVRVDDPVPAL